MPTLGLALDLSFDHPSGYYLYQDGEPVQGGLISGRKTGHPIDDMVDDVVDFVVSLKDAPLTWLAIEDVYLATYRSAKGAAPKQNVDVLIHLVDLRAPIVYMARYMGVGHRFLGKSYEIDEACGIEHFLKRPARKAAMARFAKSLTSLEMPEDVNDACCIGYWGHSRYKQYLWTLQEG